MLKPSRISPLVLAACFATTLGVGGAQAQLIFAAKCPVVSEGFWENGNPVPPRVRGDDERYVLAYYPDGLSANHDGEMDAFANCTTVDDVLRCSELNADTALGPPDPDVLKSIELNRKTGAFHAVVWLKSRPSVRRDSRGTCVFDDRD